MNHEVCNSCDGSGVLTKVCRRCNGKKFINGEVCPLCRGTGRYLFMKNQRRKQEIVCPSCNGSGKKRNHKGGQRVLTQKEGEKVKRTINQ